MSFPNWSAWAYSAKTGFAALLALFAKPLIVLRAQAAVERANRRGLEGLERGAFLKSRGGVSWWAAIIVAVVMLGAGVTYAVKSGVVKLPTKQVQVTS